MAIFEKLESNIENENGQEAVIGKKDFSVKNSTEMGGNDAELTKVREELHMGVTGEVPMMSWKEEKWPVKIKLGEKIKRWFGMKSDTPKSKMSPMNFQDKSNNSESPQDQV